MGEKTGDDMLKRLGASPAKIDRELRSFAKSSRVLSSRHPRLIDQYPKQWVGVYKGKVQASGKTIKSVVSQLAKKGIPPERAIVRFIDKNQRTMIL